jgi:hypothetical protein
VEKVKGFAKRVGQWIHDFLHAPSLQEQFEDILELDSTQIVSERPDPFGRFKARYDADNQQ